MVLGVSGFQGLGFKVGEEALGGDLGFRGLGV